MTEKKIVVPEGMLKATEKPWKIFANYPATRGSFNALIPHILEASLRWLSENPIRPEPHQVHALITAVRNREKYHPDATISYQEFSLEWQRRMFLAPEPEVPEEIKDLLQPRFMNALETVTGQSDHDRCVIEAFHRGQKSREKE